ncbi:MAG TPA: EamA family transporter [Chloroflexia bacterium]|nr:EamA family transporter [Chloroflexia bacterium]
MQSAKLQSRSSAKGFSLSQVPGQVWMVIAALSFAIGNVYDQAATQHLQRPNALVAAAIQAVPVFLYGLVGWLIVSALRRRKGEIPTPLTPEARQARNKGIMFFAIAGVITQIGTAAFFQALIVSQYQGLSVTLPFVQTWELLAILMGLYFLKERPNGSVWVGMVIIVAGLALVALAPTITENKNPLSPGWYWAMPLGLVAAICWAASSILARAGMQRGVSAFGGLSVQYLFGGVGALFLCWLTDLLANQGNMAQFGNLNGNVLLYVLGGAVINGILATGFLTFALKVSPAYKVLPINTIYPAVSVLLGWAYFGKSNEPTVLGLVALLIVAAGLTYIRLGPGLFLRSRATRRETARETR